MKTLGAVLCSIILLINTIVYAQTKDTIIDQKPFIIHTVQARETLYGISRMYDIELNDLVIANPIVIQGLNVGHSLLVPLRNVKVDKKIENPIFTSFEKDTIFKTIAHTSKTIDTSKTDSTTYFTSYLDTSLIKVALLLPFYLDLNDTLMLNNGKHLIYPKSNTALDFYFGFKLALDSLIKLGYQIDLMIQDVPNDSVFEALLENNILYDREFIFGPIYIRQFEELAKRYGYDRNKKLISPLSYKSVEGNYLNVYQSIPLSKVQLDALTDRLLYNFRNDYIVILGQKEEEDLFKYAKSKLSKQILEKRCHALLFEESDLSNRELLKEKLNVDRNVLLVPSNDRSFVSRLLPILGSMEDTSFTVFGMDTWNRFNNIDFYDLEKLNVHIPQTFIQDTSTFYTDFIELYFANYHSFPDKYGYCAYQQALYFLSNEFKYLLDFRPFNKSSLISNHMLKITHFEGFEQVVID
jgi:LysM repeat protein